MSMYFLEGCALFQVVTKPPLLWAYDNNFHANLLIVLLTDVGTES